MPRRKFSASTFLIELQTLLKRHHVETFRADHGTIYCYDKSGMEVFNFDEIDAGEVKGAQYRPEIQRKEREFAEDLIRDATAHEDLG